MNQASVARANASLRRSGGNVLPWTSITAAEYRQGWLRLHDQHGRTHTLHLLFVASAHDVVEAVQDHLPAGVRLSVY